MVDRGPLHTTTAHRHAQWGPVHVARFTNQVGVKVDDVDLMLDLTDVRPAAERRAQPYASPFVLGVPVLLAGEQVATVTVQSRGLSGLVRRERHDVTGDHAMVLPGLHLMARDVPSMLTLRTDDRRLIATRRMTKPIDFVLHDWLTVVDRDLVPPRVSKHATPEHLALWFAMAWATLG